MKRNLFKTYFSHDIYSRQDPKIKNLLAHFRKISNEKALAAVCIYWWIIEDMHADDYKISDIEAYADDYRCDIDFLKSILEDFELFHQENGCYISDRVLRNIAEQEEKSEKAKEKANKRWKKKEEAAPTETDSDFVNSIIQLYNTAFKKAQIVGNENRERIYKITKDNNLTLDVWQKVFSHAKRGWNIKGENKKPSLKNILDNWDAFASDNYFLAPDFEAIEAEKIEQEAEAEKQKRDEILKTEEGRQEYELSKKAIRNKKSAIEHLNKYYRLPEIYLKRSSMVKGYMVKYNFTIEDIMSAREKEGKSWKI